MKRIKLVMSDVDGTLINNDHEISERTKETVHKLVESGVEFGIATGRNYESASAIVRLMDLDPNKTAIVSLNGFWVDHPELDYAFRDETINYEQSKMLGEIGTSFFMGVLYFFDDKVYSHMDEKSYDDYERNVGPDRLRFFQEDFDLQRIQSIEDIKDVFTPQHQVLKIVFVQDGDYTELIKERISREFPDNYDLLMVAEGWAEIMPKTVNKGRAILEYAKFRGFDSSELLCFGDSDNDLTMIKNLGVGIAMKNGRNSVKVLANDITDSNENDGVAKYIEDKILIHYE